MKLLLLSRIFPPETGGSGRWFYEIYRRLIDMDVTVIAGEHSEATVFDAHCEVSIHRTDLKFDDWGTFNLPGYARYREVAWACRNLVRGRSFDAVHAGSLLPDGWLVRKLAHKFGIPYVVYMHGEETCFACQSRQLKWMGQKILKGAAQIIANSENTFRLIEEFWGIPGRKVTILNPGVDCRVFQPATRDRAVRERLGWGERPVVLTVGRLQRRKGQATMIKALPGLLETHPDLLYCVVGDGDERTALKQLADQLGLAAHVQFVHNCSDEMLVQCYQQCDLFVLPNREINGDIEGFGMVLLEAQACGKTVIAGRSGGTAETMIPGTTGQLADCSTEAQLIDMIGGLLNDRSRLNAMGTAARQWVSGKLDWQPLAEAAEQCFERQSATPHAAALTPVISKFAR